MVPLPAKVYALLLEKIRALRPALVFRVTVPPPPVPNVAVSLVLSEPSRPGVPPSRFQLAKSVQVPLPAVQVD